MADPLSISASIIAILQLTTSVYRFVSDVKGAPSELARLRDGIGSACTPLYMLRDRLENNDQELTSVYLLGGPDGPLNQFRKLLEQLVSRLAPKEGRWKDLDEFRKTLVWPFKKEEVQALLSAMERQKSVFHLALQNDTL